MNLNNNEEYLVYKINYKYDPNYKYTTRYTFSYNSEEDSDLPIYKSSNSYLIDDININNIKIDIINDFYIYVIPHKKIKVTAGFTISESIQAIKIQKNNIFFTFVSIKKNFQANIDVPSNVFSGEFIHESVPKQVIYSFNSYNNIGYTTQYFNYDEDPNIQNNFFYDDGTKTYYDPSINGQCKDITQGGAGYILDHTLENIGSQTTVVTTSPYYKSTDDNQNQQPNYIIKQPNNGSTYRSIFFNKSQVPCQNLVFTAIGPGGGGGSGGTGRQTSKGNWVDGGPGGGGNSGGCIVSFITSKNGWIIEDIWYSMVSGGPGGRGVVCEQNEGQPGTPNTESQALLLKIKIKNKNLDKIKYLKISVPGGLGGVHGDASQKEDKGFEPSPNYQDWWKEENIRMVDENDNPDTASYKDYFTMSNELFDGNLCNNGQTPGFDGQNAYGGSTNINFIKTIQSHANIESSFQEFFQNTLNNLLINSLCFQGDTDIKNLQLNDNDRLYSYGAGGLGTVGENCHNADGNNTGGSSSGHGGRASYLNVMLYD